MIPILALLLTAAASASPRAPLPHPRALASDDGPSAEVVDLVARGRTLIRDGRAQEAQALLDEALALHGERARTRVWVVRC